MTTVTAAKDNLKDNLKDMPLPPAPFLSSVMQIEPQWIDYNGHLNMAYYNVMMDRAIDEMWLQLGIGPTYLKERHGSTFTAEAHVRYLREIHLGDPVQISVYLLGTDEKRLHTFEELRHATEGWISATSENMTLHMDMKERKTAPFPPDIRARIAGGGECACGGAAARGHRPQSGDALEIARDRRQTCVRPRTSPTTAETRNRITAMKKIALAISTEAPAMPPKPKIPAINATIRNVTTQLNMTRPLACFSRDGCQQGLRASTAETIRPRNEGSRGQNPEICRFRWNKIAVGREIRPAKAPG